MNDHFIYSFTFGELVLWIDLGSNIQTSEILLNQEFTLSIFWDYKKSFQVGEVHSHYSEINLVMLKKGKK